MLQSIGININKLSQGADTLSISVNGATKEIELFDDAGNQLSTFDVLSQIAEQWDNMNTAEQTALASTLAGKTRFDVFSSVLSNFDDAVKATNTSLSSYGSAVNENTKYQESLEYRINAVKTEFEEFILGDGGLETATKYVLSFTAGILKFLNSGAGQFITWTTLATIGLTNISKQIEIIRAGDATGVVKKIIDSFTALSAKITSTTGTVNKLKVAFDALGGKWLVVGALITGATMAFKYWKENVSFQGQIDNLSDLLSEISETEAKVSELKEQLSAVKEQIDKINSGELKVSDDGEVERLKQQEALLQSELNLQQNILKVKQEQAKNDAQSALNASDFYKDYSPQLKNGTSGDSSLYESKWMPNYGTGEERLEHYVKSLQDYKDAMAKLDEELAQGKISNEAYQNSMGQLQDGMSKIMSNGSDLAQAYLTIQEAGGKLTDEQTQLVQQFVATSEATSETAQGLENQEQMMDALSEAFGEPIDNLDELKEKMEEAGVSTEEFEEAVANGDWATAYGYAVQAVTESTEEATSALQDSISSINDVYGAYDTLAQAVADFNSGSYIDPSSLQELMSLGTEYLNLLQMQDGQMTINEEGFQALANAQYDKAEADLYTQYAEQMSTVATMDEADALAEANKINGEYSTSNVNQQLKVMIDNVGLATDGFYELANAQTGANITGQNRTKLAKTYTAQFQAQLAMFERGRKTIGNYTTNVRKSTKATGANTSSTKGNTSSKKDNTDAQKANTEALKKNVDALKEQKEAIQDEVDNMEKVISYIKSKVNDYIDELEDAKDTQSDFLDESLDGLDKIKDALDDLFDDDVTSLQVLNNIQDTIDKIKEMNVQLHEADILGKDTTGIQAQIDALNKSLEIQRQIASYKETAEQADKEQERLQDEIDALNEKNDALQEQLEYEELLDALNQAKQSKLKVYREGEGFVYTQDQSAISEAQKALDDWLRKKKLNDQIKDLEDQRDKQKEIYDQQLKDLENLKDKTSQEYSDMVTNLETYKTQVEKRWDDQINYYKNWLKSFENGINEYENQQNRLLALEKTGIDFEQQGWQTRLSNLNSFVESYKAKLAELEEATRKLNEAQKAYEQAQAQASASGASSGGSSGGGSSGSSGYSPASTPQVQTIDGFTVGKVYKHNKGMSYYNTVDKKMHFTSTSNHGERFEGKENGSLVFTNKSGHRIKVAVKTAQANYSLTNKVSPYASGASSISDDQMALVGDSPTNNELVIGSKLNGQFMNLKKGSGVVNATSTNTLAGLLNQLPKLTSGHSINATTNNTTSSNDTVFSIGNITIDGANITDINSFKNALINIKSEALQRAYQT